MSLVLQSSGGGQITIQEPTTASNFTATLPAADGTIVVSGTTPTLNGITFPATQVPSADANTLDDYEEGTFTPTIIGTTTAGTGTYVSDSQIGRYTKIGNRVFFNIYLSWTAHTGTGNMRVSGLPFTQSSATNSFGAVSTLAANITSPASSYITVSTLTNSTALGISSQVVATQAYANLAMDTSGVLQLSGHYEV